MKVRQKSFGDLLQEKCVSHNSQKREPFDSVFILNQTRTLHSKMSPRGVLKYFMQIIFLEARM